MLLELFLELRGAKRKGGMASRLGVFIVKGMGHFFLFTLVAQALYTARIPLTLSLVDF
jgi:hypothetical protein